MKKIIVGIFAHPDDEAFGPSATLLTETKTGTELHLITLTAGENGMNPDSHENLRDVRLQEWHKAGGLIGAKQMYHLGYMDGELGNKDHVEITSQIMALVQELSEDRDDIEIEFMSTDLNGITGHIDHIVAGRSACLAFYRLKEMGLPMTRIRLACISCDHFCDINTDFVFMEPGHQPSEIDEVIDARHLADEVFEIVRCHHTQRGDGETHIAHRGKDIALNHFIVRQ